MEEIHFHPLPSVQTGCLLRDRILCIYSFPNKNSVTENKSKNAEDSEKFVDDVIIPSPECLVSAMGSMRAGGPGIAD
jgi:hypothetical protein